MRVHHPLMLVLWLTFLLQLPVRAQSPIARTQIDPKTVMVGQPVRLTIDVKVPTWMLQAPQFPSVLEIPDALAVLTDQSTSVSERIDGDTWAGIRRMYLIYPQRSGEFTVPAIPIVIVYSVNGKRSPPTTVSTQPQRFRATIPTAAADLGYFIATPSFRLTQRYEPRPRDLKVGDSLTRSITMRAEDSFAMFLPPLQFEAPEGIAVYPNAPMVRDEGGERGSLRVAFRKESTVYVMQEAGEFQLGEVGISWWDVNARRLRRARLPALTFTVEPNLELEAELAPPEEPEDETLGEPEAETESFWSKARRVAPAAGGTILGIIILIVFWNRYGRRWRNAVKQRRERRANSETTFFRRFLRAARSGDPQSTYRHLMVWLDGRYSGPASATLTEFVAESGNSELKSEADNLSNRLFAREKSKPASPWSGKELRRVTSAARKGLLRRRHPRARQSGLPTLNPDSPDKNSSR